MNFDLDANDIKLPKDTKSKNLEVQKNKLDFLSISCSNIEKCEKSLFSLIYFDLDTTGGSIRNDIKIPKDTKWKNLEVQKNKLDFLSISCSNIEKCEKSLFSQTFDSF